MISENRHFTAVVGAWFLGLVVPTVVQMICILNHIRLNEGQVLLLGVTIACIAFGLATYKRAK